MMRDIVVVGASAGGVRALETFVHGLRDDFPATVFVVMHIAPGFRSLLPDILSRHTSLPVRSARDQERYKAGHIYIAPEDMHLLVERDCARVVRGPKENRHRPAVDPLFRSAAFAYGRRVIGVVLTGALDDGTAGLWAIKQCGGIAIVQDPASAAYSDMPLNAITSVQVDAILPLEDIAPRVNELVRSEVAGDDESPRPPSLATEVGFAKMERDVTSMDKLGVLSPFTCPACRGSLWELKEGELVRYRCHTGHAFSSDALLTDQTVALEDALYSALRAVEEKATALRRLSERHNGRHLQLYEEFAARAEKLDGTAQILRTLLESSSQ